MNFIFEHYVLKIIYKTNDNMYSLWNVILFSIATNLFVALHLDDNKNIMMDYNYYLSFLFFSISGFLCIYLSIKMSEIKDELYKKIASKDEMITYIRNKINNELSESKNRIILAFEFMPLTTLGGLILLMCPSVPIY